MPKRCPGLCPARSAAAWPVVAPSQTPSPSFLCCRCRLPLLVGLLPPPAAAGAAPATRAQRRRRQPPAQLHPGHGSSAGEGSGLLCRLLHNFNQTSNSCCRCSCPAVGRQTSSSGPVQQRPLTAAHNCARHDGCNVHPSAVILIWLWGRGLAAAFQRHQRPHGAGTVGQPAQQVDARRQRAVDDALLAAAAKRGANVDGLAVAHEQRGGVVGLQRRIHQPAAVDGHELQRVAGGDEGTTACCSDQTLRGTGGPSGGSTRCQRHQDAWASRPACHGHSSHRIAPGIDCGRAVDIPRHPCRCSAALRRLDRPSRQRSPGSPHQWMQRTPRTRSTCSFSLRMWNRG